MITSDVEHLSTCLLTIWYPCLWSIYLSGSFLIELSAFFLLICRNSLYILDESCIKIMYCRYFLLVCGLPFCYFNGIFWLTNVLHFFEVHFIDLFWFMPLSPGLRNLCQSSKSFRYSVFSFRDFINFSTSVYGPLQINFYVLGELRVKFYFSHLQKRLSFSS